jgi:hypothetical protein
MDGILSHCKTVLDIAIGYLGVYHGPEPNRWPGPPVPALLFNDLRTGCSAYFTPVLW